MIRPAPVGWREAALNQGWIYRDRVGVDQSGQLLSAVLSARYRHSPVSLWLERLQLGELSLNGQVLWADAVVANGDRIEWRRPPWREPAVPEQWNTIHDNGDLLVINKPSGLPVMPGGGFLLHTLSHQLVQRSRERGEALVPKPVHRLGRFTSGLQVCAREPATRAALSRQFRPEGSCRKTYQAWARRVEGLELGQTLEVDTDVVEREHPLLGWIWGPLPWVDEPVRKRLSAHSQLRLLDRQAKGDLLEVTISTGRPHQIRIHLAQIGSPLLGDPLYRLERRISADATPGDGGYFLHAWKLELASALGVLAFEAPTAWV
ncbi:RNA pseudouridine synthase [Synechococcus sp. BS56D]|uniref:pseudouridine synthase family protein n=1 Tax=Synechococcus sp. BS56D TaxID=2055944 RepID=UPI001F105D08|nr:RNA pseudouridine synthase [Synechococcus sp. BS56D]